MCCDPYDGCPEATVGQCPLCGGDVDVNGDSTEDGCNYSPACSECGCQTCDQSC